MALKLMYITNVLEVALIAQKYGVDRVWIDLETLGKEERQKGIDAVKSHHTIDDIRQIKPYLTTSEMLVRINSWHEKSVEEVEAVIAAGADMIMLPYWKSIDEVNKFVKTVNGRCKTTLLLETKEAVENIDDVLKVGGFEEIHIGLNDLHLSYGMTFMFELLANGLVEMLCKKFKAAGIPYGFGGIARLGYGLLPAEKVIMEHYRIGSTRAILSRSFCDYAKIESVEEFDRVFRDNMKSLREYEMSIADLSREDYIRNKADVEKAVADVVFAIKKARG
jgi:2-keto-3-deoxy-L-rhamnonate aldolase RhmA